MSSDLDFSFSHLLRDCVDHEETLDPLDAYDPFDLNEPPPFGTHDARTHDGIHAAASTEKNQSHANRKKQRAKQRGSSQPYGYQVCPNTQRKHQTHVEEIPTNHATEGAPAASSGYVGRRLDEGWKRSSCIAGFSGPEQPVTNPPPRLIKIPLPPCRTATPVTDGEGRVIAVLAGQPDDPSWDGVHTSAADLLDQTRRECNFSRKQRMHRRGRYSALSAIFQITYLQHPQNLHHEGAAALCPRHPPQPHCLHTPSGICLQAHLPRGPRPSFNTMPNTSRPFSSVTDSLILNFANSIFCACTFNFGPKTATFEHTDSGNLPFGWCSVTALGRFNPKQGGHLILWDLKLVIEFPPGSTILFPSAILRHSNTPIRLWGNKVLIHAVYVGGVVSLGGSGPSVE
ncbi:uncharacterized protein EV420DRAFT_1653282 [Desarmillaria tabescens]|uniref:Uncharacterized protein n=1 Tax=Armillaria tabescens TaxID=1929756 RepID=A0AA39J3A6_ARMTA|nr:uncharacterized protein EV420DRAFT_1653282 [Desarmillaria tabescens]KAK0435336.1 hypothetical protein EV420DRAFT_1653282 [Desarmillaria tabescens]